MGLVQEVINNIRKAVQKRIDHLKALEAMAIAVNNLHSKYETRGGIDELETLMAHLPKEDD